MEWLKPGVIIATLLYSIIGIIMFWVAFLIVDRLTPYDLWAELVEKKNTALALVVAAMCLGIAIIVAASVHG